LLLPLAAADPPPSSSSQHNRFKRLPFLSFCNSPPHGLNLSFYTSQQKTPALYKSAAGNRKQQFREETNPRVNEVLETEKLF
jgi:hypothetical protein